MVYKDKTVLNIFELQLNKPILRQSSIFKFVNSGITVSKLIAYCQYSNENDELVENCYITLFDLDLNGTIYLDNQLPEDDDIDLGEIYRDLAEFEADHRDYRNYYFGYDIDPFL